MRTTVLAPAFGCALALAACGGATPAPNTAPTSTVAVAVAPPPAPSGMSPIAAAAPPAGDSDARTMPRSAVLAVVSDGLGAFLQRVDLDDQPVLVGGRFHGFRIAALRDGQSWSGFWSGVDLKPGDVITSVNGFPIEHPEQAQTAFDSLEVASELRVSYERGGQGRALVYSIVDSR